MNEPSSNPFDLINQIKSKGPAPVHLWNPPYCGEIDMRISKSGKWFYEGSEIKRPAMVRLFANVIRLDDDGFYYLVTPVERVRIKVDDCPFIVQLLQLENPGPNQFLVFTTNTDERVVVDDNHPMEVETSDESDTPHPLVLVRSNLKALISRNVYYQLVDMARPVYDAESNITTMMIDSGGVSYSLGEFSGSFS